MFIMYGKYQIIQTPCDLTIPSLHNIRSTMGVVGGLEFWKYHPDHPMTERLMTKFPNPNYYSDPYTTSHWIAKTKLTVEIGQSGS